MAYTRSEKMKIIDLGWPWKSVRDIVAKW